MENQTQTLQPQIAVNSAKITNHQLGFRSAQHAKSNPNAIESSLNLVYNRFLDEQKLDEQGLKERISKLKAEVQQEKMMKNDIVAQLMLHKRNKEEKEKEIEELAIEKVEIKNGGVEVEDTNSFVIGAFITLLLTLYLFVFYSASGYSAFYGVKPGSLGFINPNVFTDAMNKGGGVIALIILFPVIFLGLGFLIHNSLEMNKKLVAENKPKQYALIIGLLFLTLIADSFIGYKISQGVHTNEFNAGTTDSFWQFSMVFTDINFYLVLILGFAVYVIWGFLLHYVLGHAYLKPLSQRIKLMLEILKAKIEKKHTELTAIITKIQQLESDRTNIENKIQEKEKDIIGYENGVMPINIASLKGLVGQFMGGWQSYTHNNFDTNEAEVLIAESFRLQENWLSQKIQSLN